MVKARKKVSVCLLAGFGFQQRESIVPEQIITFNKLAVFQTEKETQLSGEW